MTTLRLGTRGSQLALIQANMVAALLRARAGVSCDVIAIKTSGDRPADAPLAQIGGKRVFVKEIEDALLDGAVDLAVHSSKDLPAELPDGLALGATLPREDPRDAIVLPATIRRGPVTSGVEQPASAPASGRSQPASIFLQQMHPRGPSTRPRSYLWKTSCDASAKRPPLAPAA